MTTTAAASVAITDFKMALTETRLRIAIPPDRMIVGRISSDPSISRSCQRVGKEDRPCDRRKGIAVEEVALMSGKLLLELILDGRRGVDGCETGDEIRRALLHILAVLAVAAQHDVLLVTPHHQHRHEQSWLL